MCRNGQYTERGIKEIHGFMSERWRIEPEYAMKVDPSLGLLGVLLEPTTVVTKAWEQVVAVGQLVDLLDGAARRHVRGDPPLQQARTADRGGEALSLRQRSRPARAQGRQRHCGHDRRVPVHGIPGGRPGAGTGGCHSASAGRFCAAGEERLVLWRFPVALDAHRRLGRRPNLARGPRHHAEAPDHAVLPGVGLRRGR